MTTERDMTRIVRSWLRTDEHESADRVLDNVLALLDATPQRRSWWPARRIADMNTFAKLATAIAAVVVAAVVGINLLPGGGPGGPTASPSPSPSPSPYTSPSPTPTPPPSAAALIFAPAGPLDPGRHALSEDRRPFSVMVPAGWSSSGANCGICASDAGYLFRGTDGSTDPGAVWMPVWSVDVVSADPCAKVPAPGATSAAELAADVAALPGTDVITAPEDVTVGGRPAKHVAIKVREDIECTPRQFQMWGDNGVFRWATTLGETNHVWIADLEGGGHFWIEAETYKGSTPALQEEIQAMIDSIEFE
jgi:hypothetical protein